MTKEDKMKVALKEAETGLNKGALDLSYIFGTVLKNFRGKLILEITQSREDLIKSKEMMEELLNSGQDGEGYIPYEFK